MATAYADRAFLAVNGAPLLDLQTASLKQNKNARAVPSMTPNGRNRGFVQGNLDIDIMAQIAVLNQLATPKIEAIDFEAADISISFVCGADQYVVIGVFLKENDINAGSVGDEAKKTWNFGALDVVDAVGNSVLFDIQL